MPSNRIRPLTPLAWLLVAAALLPGVSTPGVAHAVAVPVTIEGMSRTSKTVVIARVAAVTPRSLPAPAGAVRGAIVSDVDLEVERALVGAPGRFVRVTVLGGQIGGVRLAVDEMPLFTPGERCLVFIDGRGKVRAARQGKLEIVGDSVPALDQPLRTVERRVAHARTALAGDPWFATVQELIADGADLKPLAVLTGPGIADISPDTQPAGVGATVTVSGTGFGYSPGTITFKGQLDITGTRLATVAAPIVSWSDSEVVCTVPTGASSGSVTLTPALGTGSYTFDYVVGFSYGGTRWWSPTTLAYRVNPNCADATADELGGALAAFTTWNGASNLTYAYEGASALASHPAPSDWHNDIFWASAASFDSPEIVAQNEIWFGVDAYGGVWVAESNIAMNDGYPWGDAGTTPGVYDIQSVAAHEIGHTLFLMDQYGAADSGKVMYGFVGPGQIKRTASQEDREGIGYLFQGPYEAIGGTTSFNSGRPLTATRDIAVTSAWPKATGVRFDVGLGFGAWQTYAANMTLPLGVTDGVYPVRAEYRSATGVRSWIQPGATITLDTQPPMTSAAVLATYVGSASIVISPLDTLAGVAWTDHRLDGVEASGTLVTTSAPGSHTLQHRAVDNAGNIGAWSAPQSFTVIPLPPAAPGGATAAAGAPAPSIALSWTDNSSDETGFVIERSADGGAWAVVATPAANTTSWSDPLLGVPAVAKWGTSWSYRVKATNLGGDSPYATAAGIILDTTPPTVGDDATASYYETASILITASDAQSGLARIEQELDGVASIGGSVSTAVLGPHTLRYRAVDNVGNATGWTSVGFSVVAGVPTPIAGVSAAAGTPAPSVALSWVDVANETRYTVERSRDGDAFELVTTLPADTVSWTDTLEDLTPVQQWRSSLRYRLVAANASGTTSAVSAPLLLDSAAPTSTAVVVPVYYVTASIPILASDGSGSGVARIEYRLDGGAETSGSVVTTAALGPHVLEHRAVDVAGFTSEWSAPQSFTVAPAPWPSYASLSRSASRIRYGKRVTLSGYVTPTIAGGVVLQVRKPYTRRYTSVVAVPYAGVSGTVGTWSRSYKPSRRGTWYFRVRAINPNGTYGVVSRTVSVYVR